MTAGIMFRILLLVFLAFSVRCQNDCIDTRTSLFSPALTTTDFIHRDGYPNETHIVTTSDGYVLQMHRIPFGKYVADYQGVAFLMHGVESSSADWVVAGQEKSLAFILADLGFDVWMGNARGNKYSRKHVKLNPDFSKTFWDFSWHEIGVIDLPTMIDYVLKETGEKQVMYFGHSQGTTTFFVMASELPEYNKKIKIMHALAPVIFMDHVSNAIKAVLPLLKLIQLSLDVLTTGEFINSNDMLSRFNSIACKNEAFITQGICTGVLTLLFGYDPANLNKTLLSDIVHNYPAGCSSDQLVHFGQVVKSGKFAQFDHGILENLPKYKNIKPPEYNLKKVTAKVALYVGPKDNLATPKDVEKLAAILPNVVEHYMVPHQDFNHVDFIFAIHIWELLYGKLFEVIYKHT